METSQWHILGAGAIGCLFSRALQQVTNTTLLLRPGVAHNHAITVEINGQAHALSLPCSPTDASGKISHLLVTTKAYDVETALHSVAHRLDAGATIVLLINGMGLLERVQQNYAQHAIFCATTTAGAHRLAPLHIKPAGEGHTRVGAEQQIQPAPWFPVWRDAIPGCHWDANIQNALWHKLAVNAVINPLTAIYRCRNGQLAQQTMLQTRVEQLCEEACEVSYAAGYSNTAASLPADVQRVIKDTADNRSSMLQDIDAGRRTEIDYINGYLLKVADAHGIEAAQHRALFNEVKTIAH